MTDTPARPELVAAFRDLHRPGRPLLMPNPWDVGSARVLAALGYRALATTSSGFAATLGRLDGTVTREQALRHAADIVAATELPVSADLENGFADEPEAVAELVRDAIGVGLAGCSIEDATGRLDDPIYEPRLAAERVAAAAELPAGGRRRPLCARTDPGRPDQGRPELGRPTGQRARHAGRPKRRGARRPRCQPRVGGRILRVRRARRLGEGGPGAAGRGHLRIRATSRPRSRRRPDRIRRRIAPGSSGQKEQPAGYTEEETGSRVTTRRSPVSDTMLISVPSLVRRARTAPSATAPTSWVTSPRAGGDQSSRVRNRPEARSTPRTPTGMLGATSGVGVAAWTPTAVHRRVGLPLA